MSKKKKAPAKKSVSKILHTYYEKKGAKIDVDVQFQNILGTLEQYLLGHRDETEERLKGRKDVRHVTWRLSLRRVK